MNFRRFFTAEKREESTREKDSCNLSDKVSVASTTATDIAETPEQISLKRNQALFALFASGRYKLDSHEDPNEFVKMQIFNTEAETSLPSYFPESVQSRIRASITPVSYYLPKTAFNSAKTGVVASIVSDLERTAKYNLPETSIVVKIGSLEQEVADYQKQIAKDQLKQVFARARENKGIFAYGEQTEVNLREIGRDKLADALSKHMAQLNLGVNLVDYTKINLEKIKGSNSAKIFPRELKKVEELQSKIESLVSKRNNELRILEINNRVCIEESYRDSYDGGRTKTAREIVLPTDYWRSKAVKDMHRAVSALSAETLYALKAPIIARYDPQILALCMKRTKYEREIIDCFTLIEEEKDIRQMGKADYKRIQRAWRNLNRKEK